MFMQHEILYIGVAFFWQLWSRQQRLHVLQIFLMSPGAGLILGLWYSSGHIEGIRAHSPGKKAGKAFKEESIKSYQIG